MAEWARCRRHGARQTPAQAQAARQKLRQCADSVATCLATHTNVCVRFRVVGRSVHAVFWQTRKTYVLGVDFKRHLRAPQITSTMTDVQDTAGHGFADAAVSRAMQTPSLQPSLHSNIDAGHAGAQNGARSPLGAATSGALPMSGT